MDSNFKKSQLGNFLKEFLKNNSISMRKLSKLTGMDTATISRIINNKQPANINHIEKLSKYLKIPMEVLLKAAGYNIGSIKEKYISNKESTLNDILKSLDYKYDIHEIEMELNKYEQYASTDEGKNIIQKDFKKKLKSTNGSGIFIEKLNDMYNEFLKDSSSKEKKNILGSCLLYFILTTDIIPDYIFPIGYIDDIVALKLVEQRLKNI